MNLSKEEREKLINDESLFDAYLNSVRAEGADMLAASQRAKIGKPHQNDAVLAYSARVATEFAAQLRSQEAK